MYVKNLQEDLRLRLSKDDMDFLRSLSDDRSQSVSECIRSIIGEYRRALDNMNTFKRMIQLAEKEGAVHGDTETHLVN